MTPVPRNGESMRLNVVTHHFLRSPKWHLVTRLLVPLFVILLNGILSPGAARGAEDISPTRACTLLRNRIGTLDGLSASAADKLWDCDITTAADPDWYVIGLRSHRNCASWAECSNLRGWFAVNRRSGHVRYWNTAEYVVGDEIQNRP
jgi:hypothetical protein